MNVQDNVCLFVWSLFPKIRCLRDKNSLENIFGIKEDKGRIPNVMERSLKRIPQIMCDYMISRRRIS